MHHQNDDDVMWCFKQECIKKERKYLCRVSISYAGLNVDKNVYIA